MSNHLGFVTAVTFAGDRILFADSAEGYVYVADLATGQVLGREERHRGPITAMEMIDGDLVTASLDGTIRFRSKRLHGHSSGIHGLSVHGTRAVSAGFDGTIRIWDLANANCEQLVEAHNEAATDVAWLSDHQVVSASRDRLLRIWDTRTGECLRTLEGHRYWVTKVARVGQTSRLVSTGEDATIRLWDSTSGRMLWEDTAGYVIWGLGVSPDGRYAVVGSNVAMWNLDTGEKELLQDLSAERAVAISPDSRLVLLGDDRGTVTLYDTDSRQVRWRIRRTRDGALATAARGGHFVTGFQSGAISIDRQVVGGAHEAMAYSVTCLAYNRVATAGFDGKINVWDVATGQCVRTIPYPGTYVFSLRSSADGRRMLAVGSDAWELWDSLDSIRRVTAIGSGNHTHGDLSRDGEWVVTAGVDDRIRIWRSDGGVAQEIRHEAGQISDICFIPHVNAMLLASASGTLSILDADTHSLEHLHQCHEDWIRSVRVTSDGRYAVSTSQNFRTHLYDLQSRRLLDRPSLPIEASAIDEDDRIFGLTGNGEFVSLNP